MRFLREFSGIGSRPYPLDRERRRRVMVALAEKDMTIGGLARELDLALSQISMTVCGRRRSIIPNQYSKTEKLIADFLGKDAGWLFPNRTQAEIKKMREGEAASKRGPA